ncbi:hypothetical protein RJ641_021839 [Dillenia turbinata]|uniref:Uncharacterized protein n=1 Tax=Dillenia turbinata TaxID=194707 RepID=A0AAN8UQI9_9MAGN
MAEFFRSDCASILSDMKHIEKRLQHKRRLLIGLPTSSRYAENQSLPESLLRDDDVFYGALRAFVEECFRALNVEMGHAAAENDLESLDSWETLYSQLDSFTSWQLYHLTKIITGGSVNFAQTRSQMKKIVKEYIRNLLNNRMVKAREFEFSRLISQLHREAHNTGENHVIFASQSHKDAAYKVIYGLNDMTSESLFAMYRKLRGVQASPPLLRPKKSSWTRDRLADRIRSISLRMLSELGEGEALQEPLAKAMAVASLSLTVFLGHKDYSLPEFHQFSPKIEALHNEIIKAIWSLDKVRISELKTLQVLLDPNAKLPSRSLRTAIRNLLTMYLYESSEMDAMPKSLFETLAIINKDSRSVKKRYSLEKEIDNDIECILAVSAHVKQIVWDLLPEKGFDLDFKIAYMEDLEDCDNGDIYYDNGREPELDALQSSNLVESVGESKITSSKCSTPTPMEGGISPLVTPNATLISDSVVRRTNAVSTDGLGFTDTIQESISLIGSRNIKLNQVESYGNTELLNSCNFKPEVADTTDSEKISEFCPPVSSHDDTKHMFKENMDQNQYLAIQEVCDENSKVAYSLIGRVLEGIAEAENLNLDWTDVSYLRGKKSTLESQVTENAQPFPYEKVRASVIAEAVRDLMPSFSKSGMKKLNELMGLP